MLKELKTQHRTIIQMVFSGFSNNEIAERLEMSPSSVSTIIRSPLGQAYLGGLNDKAAEDTLDVRKKLTSLNKSALSTFERILDPRQKAPHAVQATIAKDILDRNGYKPPDRLNIDMTLTAKTDAEIDAEIASLEESLNKTHQQDPVKQIADQDQDQDQDADQDSYKNSHIKDAVLGTVKEVLHEDKDSDESIIEADFFNAESFDLDEETLEKIPADLFDSSSKAS